MKNSTFNPIPFIANELDLSEIHVASTVKLLQEGNTVPFIARYRKEATGNFDETHIRNIQERLSYLLELEERKQTILTSIESQGKLDGTLRKKIENCMVKNELEDLYLPFKPKRRTKAAIAREKGLEPLALLILQQPMTGSPEKEAATFVNPEKNVANIEEALTGARDIAAEMISENSEVRSSIRDVFANEGVVVSKVATDKANEPTKFEQYYDFKEKASKIPSHRYLAIRRGEKENVLQFHIDVEADPCLHEIRRTIGFNPTSPFAPQLDLALQDSYKRLIAPSIETDLRVELKMQSDRAAVDVFALNLRNLLMASPIGSKAIIGIDPGIRTGCKCAGVDATGKFLDYTTLFLSQGDRSLEQAKSDLRKMIAKVDPYAIGVGNGTAGRETEAFVRQFLKDEGLSHIILVSVSESGASIYSASDVAREEFPDLDLTIRGAISIARRLQDPLAELVKVDPKSIGVGQYQHDVYQQLLQDKLKEIVESCVNQVGVELNTASASLLTYVAGIGPGVATKIVKHREKNGPFQSRQELLEVSGLGPRIFEQSAGFLRIRDSKHPLDASSVHPERYTLVEKIANDRGIPLNGLLLNTKAINEIPVKNYISDSIGIHTLTDIIAELKKPGRDPRAQFEPPCFRDDIQSIKDLKPGMKLDGIVTNVTAFGAFVDIGVHQDGLVHISEITDRFIKDPAEVLQVGNKIKVEVLTVEVEKKRISLTARLNRQATKAVSEPSKAEKGTFAKKPKFSNNPFASL
jgi:uncharacterized protein